jgi:hypothetical protein
MANKCYEKESILLGPLRQVLVSGNDGQAPLLCRYSLLTSSHNQVRTPVCIGQGKKHHQLVHQSLKAKVLIIRSSLQVSQDYTRLPGLTLPMRWREAPLRNRETTGCWPNCVPPMSSWVIGITENHYDPVLFSSMELLQTSTSTPLPQHQLTHTLHALEYEDSVEPLP